VGYATSITGHLRALTEFLRTTTTSCSIGDCRARLNLSQTQSNSVAIQSAHTGHYMGYHVYPIKLMTFGFKFRTEVLIAPALPEETPKLGTRGISVQLSTLCVSGVLCLAACGSDASGSKQSAPETLNSPALASSATTGGSTSLGDVDACSLLTSVDFATATDNVQPKGFPPSSYTLRTRKVKTDVSPAVDQHSACTYYFSGHPGASGEITLDVMTAAEYKTLGQFEKGKPIAGLGDEAAVYGQRPALRRGERGAVIANSSSSIAFGKEILRAVAPRL
jgi:hypothetical protein